MAYYRRSSWTSIPKGGTVLAGSGRAMTAIYIHYPGQAASIGTASVASTRNRLAGYRRQHKNVNGWADIAYNLAVDQSGNVWELRGIDRQSGANGGTKSNRSGQAILVLVGNNETPTAECIAGIKDAVARIRKQHPKAKTIRGHQQSPDASTACPGAHLMRLVRAGGLEPGSTVSVPSGGTTVPAPAKQDPWETSPRVRGMSAAEVRKVQKALQDRGYDLGKWGVDGKYAEATYNAVRAAQKALGVAVDGIAGPDTMNALTKKPASKPAAKPKAPAFPLPRKAPNDLFYYGPRSGPRTSISGQTRNTNVPNDVVKVAGRWRSKGLARWQQRMIDRGWNELKSAGGADGRFGKTTEKVVGQFQKSKGLKVDHKIGPATWAAAWTEKVT